MNNRRVHERVSLQLPATLLSPEQKKITATLVNISVNGLLLSDFSHPIAPSLSYRIKFLSPAGKTVSLTGNYVRKHSDQVVLRITHHHLDSKELLESFIADLKTTNELIELLDDGWLDHLFENENGQDIKLKYF